MKKFEEKLRTLEEKTFKLDWSPGIRFWYDLSTLVNIFGDWVSPEDHQAEVRKIELQNLKYREEIARMQKSLRKKNKAIKELNGSVKKNKARLKECEDLRIEANNQAAMEYSLKCEVVEERAKLTEEVYKLKSQLEKQQPEIPEFVAEYLEAAKEDCWTLFNVLDDSLSLKVGDWLRGGNFSNQEILAQAWLHGYTVAKEKRFYLSDVNFGFYISDLSISDVHSPVTIYQERARQFTQQEIDSMETGSYEQIEVGE